MVFIYSCVSNSNVLIYTIPTIPDLGNVLLALALLLSCLPRPGCGSQATIVTFVFLLSLFVSRARAFSLAFPLFPFLSLSVLLVSFSSVVFRMNCSQLGQCFNAVQRYINPLCPLALYKTV